MSKTDLYLFYYKHCKLSTVIRRSNGYTSKLTCTFHKVFRAITYISGTRSVLTWVPDPCVPKGVAHPGSNKYIVRIITYFFSHKKMHRLQNTWTILLILRTHETQWSWVYSHLCRPVMWLLSYILIGRDGNHGIIHYNYDLPENFQFDRAQGSIIVRGRRQASSWDLDSMSQSVTFVSSNTSRLYYRVYNYQSI